MKKYWILLVAAILMFITLIILSASILFSSRYTAANGVKIDTLTGKAWALRNKPIRWEEVRENVPEEEIEGKKYR